MPALLPVHLMGIQPYPYWSRTPGLAPIPWVGDANESAQWKSLADVLKSYDQNMVKDWKEDIDTMLVFVSLGFPEICGYLICAL